MREGIAQIQRAASQTLAGEPISWVRPETIHLTLRFLGETSTARLDPLLRSAETSARSWEPFDLHMRGLGCFPDLRRPRIVWIGVSDGSGSLPSIAQELERIARMSGFAPEERPFSPHLTVARVKDRLSAEGAQRLGSFLRDSSEVDIASIRVETIDLMRSELKPSGPVYSLIAALDLGAVRMGST